MRRALPVLVAALARFKDQEQLHIQCLDAFTDMFGGHGADCVRYTNAHVLAAVVSTMKAFERNRTVTEGALAFVRKASECSLFQILVLTTHNTRSAAAPTRKQTTHREVPTSGGARARTGHRDVPRAAEPHRKQPHRRALPLNACHACLHPFVLAACFDFLCA